MTKRPLKTALYAACAATLAISVTTTSFAQFQQNRSQNRPRQNQQSESPLGDLIGMIGRASAKSKAKKRWAQIGPEIQQCANTYLESRKITVKQMMAQGLSPDHEEVTPIVTMCQSVTTTQLKANYNCNRTNLKGVQVATYCVQSYAKLVGLEWLPISKDDYLRAAGGGAKVNIIEFEATAARNARVTEERQIMQEEAAKAAERAAAVARDRAATEASERRERAQREEAERQRFAASPEGRRQAAEQLERERRAVAEARRSPRGYKVACSGITDSRYNLHHVNCTSPASVLDGLRWAHNRLRNDPSLGIFFADYCLEGFQEYSRFMSQNMAVINSADFSRTILDGYCNVGLMQMRGPSFEQERRR